MPLDFFRKVILTGLLIFWARGSLNQLAAGVLVAAFFLVLGRQETHDEALVHKVKSSGVSHAVLPE